MIENKRKWNISYISNSGLFVANNIVEADTRQEALEEIIGDTGVQAITLVIEIKNKKNEEI